MKKSVLLWVVFGLFLIYSVYALLYNQEQDKKDMAEVERIRQSKANEPQKYDANGNPIAMPIVGNPIFSNKKIPDPINTIRGVVAVFGFMA